MMVQWWLLIIIGAVCSEIGAYFERRRWRKKKLYPFSWTCISLVCGFKVQATDAESLKRIVDVHLITAHGMGKANGA